MTFNRICCGVAFVLATISWSPGYSAEQPSPPQRVYVFGDSYSDIGAGYVDGNGPTAVAYLAQEMGLEMTYPGSATASLTSSLDFAVSAAKSDDRAGKAVKENLLGRGLISQAMQFSELARDHVVAFEPESTVAFIAIGINDGGLQTEQTTQNIAVAVSTLYRAGLRRFVIADLPENLAETKVVAARLNPAFVTLRTQLQVRYHDARFSRSRWGGFFDQVYTSPDQFGITNTSEPCAPGRALFDQDTTACATPDAYFYYHPGHPSKAVHKIVGSLLATEIRAGNY